MAEKEDPDKFTKPFLLTKTSHRDPYPAISPEDPKNFQGGKIIVITGGGSGIGAAAAKVWARAGASSIVIAGRRLQLLLETAQEIQHISPHAVVLTVQADITSEDDVKNLYARVQKTFGRPADVLINNAGFLRDGPSIGEQSVSDWWEGLEINLKGIYAMIHHYIATQPNPKDPVGTIINVSSGRAGVVTAGGSSYNIAKLAEQRLTEHVHLEYPRLRVFTTMPGIVKTSMAVQGGFWIPFALDHADLVGMLALYLVQPRADYLRGGMVGVNWDVDELEANKDVIAQGSLLKIAWLSALPIAGGKGFSA